MIDISLIVAKLQDLLISISVIGFAVLLVFQMIYIFTPLRQIINDKKAARRERERQLAIATRQYNKIRRQYGFDPIRAKTSNYSRRRRRW